MDTTPTLTARPRYLSATETAVLVRQQLKACFPTTRFSVRTSKYSGGASIELRWTDGPTEAAVRNATARYRRSWFDGMDDSTHYHPATLISWPDARIEAVGFGVDFIDGERDFSPAYLAVLTEYATELVARHTGRQFAPNDHYTDALPTPWGMLGDCQNGHSLLWRLSQHIPAPETAVTVPAKTRTRKPRTA